MKGMKRMKNTVDTRISGSFMVESGRLLFRVVCVIRG